MIAIAVEVLTCRQSESTAGSRQCRARAHRHHWGHGTGAHCSQDFLQRSQLHNCFLIVSYHFSLSLSLSYLFLSHLHWFSSFYHSLRTSKDWIRVRCGATGAPRRHKLPMTISAAHDPWAADCSLTKHHPLSWKHHLSIKKGYFNVTSFKLHAVLHSFQQNVPKNHLLKCISQTLCNIRSNNVMTPWS